MLGPGSYGEAFADVYDDWYGDVSDVVATVKALRAIAGEGPVLELGVGTGRIALPLAATGTVVDGIDASPAMLSILAAKDPAGSVRAVLGDMVAPPMRGPYRAVFATFNTFFNLWRADDQVRCVEAAAALLGPEGVFAVELFVPDPGADGPVGADEPEHVDERDDGAGGRVIRRTRRDRSTQTVRGVFEHHRDDGTVVTRDWIIRYLSPTQLDELCAGAGLILWRRWADWAGTPFVADGSTHHVSVYRHA